jgi:hypothetical protein
MEDLLRISPDFWNIEDPSSTDYLNDIKNGRVINEHVAPEVVKAWSSPDGEIEVDTVDSLLKLLAQNINSCVALSSKLTQDIMSMQKDESVCAEIAPLIGREQFVKLILVGFKCEIHWCFAIFNTETRLCDFITTGPAGPKMAWILMSMGRILRTLNPETNTSFRSTFIPISKDLRCTLARHSLIWSFMSLLKYFVPITNANTALELNSNRLTHYEVRLLYALALQTWEVSEKQNSQPFIFEKNDTQSIFHEFEPQFLFSPLRTSYSEILIDFNNLEVNDANINVTTYQKSPQHKMLDDFISFMDLPPTKDHITQQMSVLVSDELRTLKEQVQPKLVCLPRVTEIDTTAVWKDRIHPIVAAVTYLNSTRGGNTINAIELFMLNKWGMERPTFLPLFMSIFYTNGIEDYTDYQKRPIHDRKGEYFLTQYGFENYIKNCSIIKGYPSKQDKCPVTYSFACDRRGRKARNTNHVAFIEGDIQKNQRNGTWIGFVNQALKYLRRPVSINELVAYFESNPEIPIDEQIRADRTKLHSSIAQGARAGCTTNRKTTSDFAVSAIRKATFYRFIPEDDKEFLTGPLDEVTEGWMYENRFMSLFKKDHPHFSWSKLDKNEPLLCGWVLRRTVKCPDLFEITENSVITKIALPKNLLIRYSKKPDWFLRRARHGQNIQLVTYGSVRYAELQCSFDAKDELNINLRQ